MAGVNTSNWEHADWQEASTPAERLAGLVQHITEVRMAVVEFAGADGRALRINTTYLQSLQDQEKELRAAVAIAGIASRNSNVPTVVSPQF